LKKYQNRKKIKKSHILIIGILLGLIPLIFNDMGLVHLFKLKKEQSSIQNDINQLVSEEIWINEEILRLKGNDEYIKQLARQRFHMVKPNEKVFRVIDNRKIDD
tara:strand:+ start:117 stop:428 length:312 start_codon:yes stop_codon:yes gene_type:complete